MEKATVESAIQYARDIADGKIVSSKYVKLQCERFINDLDERQFDGQFRWTFNHQEASHVLTFMQLLNFVEGPTAGTNIILQPWQAFAICNLYGWVDKADQDIRRYTRSIILVARKNGKSTLLGALALYEVMYAPEGSQIVTLATQREQAKLVWGMSGRMAERSDPRLTTGLKQTLSTISNAEKWTKYTPLSKESKRLDGLNIRLAIADESAAITNHDLFEVVTSSQGNQKSPQILHITTGQPGAQSNYFYGQLDYAKKVLDEIINDERLFCLAYQIDEGDDWRDEDVWLKANPNLGVSVQKSFLQEEKGVAEEITSAAANFRTKYMNEFISTNQAWVDVNVWDKNKVEEVNDKLPLYIGLDLGATDDLTAVGLVWAEGGQFHCSAKCFIPEETFKNVKKHVRPVYLNARDDGSLIITEGEIADHDAIYEYILQLAETYDVKEVAYDSWSATHLTSRLQDAGMNMVRMDQSMKAMSPASKETEILIKNGSLKHEGLPLLSWQISNCEVFVDVNENIKVRKGEDSALKIDAIIAIIMGIARATAHGASEPKKEFQFFF